MVNTSYDRESIMIKTGPNPNIDEFFQQDLEKIFRYYLLYLIAIRDGKKTTAGIAPNHVEFTKFKGISINLSQFRSRFKNAKNITGKDLLKQFGIQYNNKVKKIIITHPDRFPESCNDLRPNLTISENADVEVPEKPVSLPEKPEKPFSFEFKLRDVFFACVRAKNSNVYHKIGTANLITIDGKKLSMADFIRALKREHFKEIEFQKLVKEIEGIVPKKVKLGKKMPSAIADFAKVFGLDRDAPNAFNHDEIRALNRHAILKQFKPKLRRKVA